MRWFFLLLICGSLWAQNYDLIIANGRILDGTGAPWFRGDIAITGDRIVAVGNLATSTAKQRIEGSGLVVAPGFIDMHSHARSGIFATPSAEPLIRQGVTTVVEGQDGSSPLPVATIWERIQKVPLGVNYATMVGHGTIRAQVMGTANRHATPAEVQKMVDLAVQAMRDGAFGLSTGLFYVPGNFAKTEEVIEIARAVGKLGGFHISHMREEGDNILDAVLECIRIGEEGGLPTQVTHHKIIGGRNWGKSKDTLAAIHAARLRGVDVTIDQYPYTASSTGTAALFPQWSLAGGNGEFVKRLADPEQRAKIKEGVIVSLRDTRGAGSAKNVVMASCSWDPKLNGKSLAQITDERGKTPDFDNAAEVAIEIQTKGGCSAVYHAIDERDLEAILRDPLTMIGSDGYVPLFRQDVPHPRCYGTFARVLGRYVRERKVLTLEEAVRRMTSLPAARMKLADRGILRPGMKADLVVFDPEKVQDKATFTEPHQYAEGFVHVVVNGRVALQDGKMTGTRTGVALRGPGYAGQ